MATATVAAIGYEAFCTAVLTTVVMEQFMSEKRSGTAHGRWAEFRFGVVGSLLSAQPPRGELEQALTAARRRPAGVFSVGGPAYYLPEALYLEGHLATVLGDTTGAIRAYRHMRAPGPCAVTL